VEFDRTESVVLPHSPTSVASARRFIAERVSGPQAYDVTLVVSELVTNALLYSRGALRLTSVHRGDEISIEVWDGDAGGLPVPRTPEPGLPGGRGLGIVEAICASWGHRLDPPGKTVWGTIVLDVRHSG
jgi:anti-sigma regulatory factor (Ser/Thr protein kinase)